MTGKRPGRGRPPTPVQELSPVARRIRKALDGRTQAWLAAQTGINPRAISFWMRGRGDGRPSNPSLESVELIAKALDVSPGWLAFGEGEAP